MTAAFANCAGSPDSKSGTGWPASFDDAGWNGPPSDDSDADAPDPARFTGVDLELKQQADFIAAARRAAERAGANGVPPRDRKISIKELEASRAPRFAPKAETNASVAVGPSRKSLILAGLTGVAILAAAAPVGRSLFENARSGPPWRRRRPAPSPLTRSLR